MDEFRKLIFNGEFEYNRDVCYHSGNARLIDYHWRDIHNFGIRYIKMKKKWPKQKETKTLIIPTRWPHEECRENVHEISDCPHLVFINKYCEDFIELLKQREKNGYGTVGFELETMIKIKSGKDKELFEFEGNCNAKYLKKGRDKGWNEILHPNKKIYTVIYRDEDYRNPYNYFMGSIEVSGHRFDGLDIKVFPLSDMKDRVENAIGEYAESVKLILKPLYGAITVTILGAATDFFSKDGKEKLERVIINELQKPPEEQNEVIMKMLNCKGLGEKKERFINEIYELSIHPSSL